MEIFVGARYEVEVATVTEDRNGKPRPPEQWYSVVREIHFCKQGKRTLEPSNPLPLNPSTPRTQGTLVTDQHSSTVNTPLAYESEKAPLSLSKGGRRK
jgi:hypothetical protein